MFNLIMARKKIGRTSYGYGRFGSPEGKKRGSHELDRREDSGERDCRQGNQKKVKDKVPREKSTANFETTTKMTKKYQTKGKDSRETETCLTQRKSY